MVTGEKIASLDVESAQCKYARDAISRIIGSNGWTGSSETYFKVFQSLSGFEELKLNNRDRLGRRGCTKSQSNSEEYPGSSPWIDNLALELKGKLSKENPFCQIEPLWPEARPFALCLTHDIDVVSRKSYWAKFCRRVNRAMSAKGPKRKALEAALGAVFRMLSEAGKRDPLGHYEDWVNMESRQGFQSTFFAFPTDVSAQHVYDAEYRFTDPVIFSGQKMSVREMLKIMDEGGCEIGLHASIESARDVEMLKSQKAQIENIVGHEIVSVRQHYLMYDILSTPGLQGEAGFKCDSTIGYADSVGFRAGTSFPYWCWDWSSQRPLPLLEIPMAIMDVTLFGIPVDEALGRCVKLMDDVERVGGCLVLNWHPNYINDQIVDIYKALLEEGRLRRAWGCRAADLDKWWRMRDAKFEVKGDICQIDL